MARKDIRFDQPLDEYDLGLENIMFQPGFLYEKLTACVGKLRDEGSFTTEAILKSNISFEIKRLTGMYVDFLVDKKVMMNAYILLPSVDKNHVFVQDFFRTWAHPEVGLTLINAMKDIPKGTVDLRNCRVGGIFEKIRLDVVMGHALISDRQFSNGEIAAIILHELGHGFTYFENLGTVVRGSLITGAAAKAVMTVETQSDKIKVLEEAERTLGIEIKDKPRLAADRNSGGKIVQSVMITTLAERSRKDTGLNYYELRSIEQLADQFALRHGAGADLVTALARLNTIYMHRSTINMALHILVEAIKLVVFCAGLLVVPIPLLVYVLLTNPMVKVYDDPEARVKFVRMNLINELKVAKIEDKRRRALLADIEAIEVVEETLDDKLTTMQLMWSTLMPEGRRAADQEATQKQLEALISNDLFVLAAKLKSQ